MKVSDTNRLDETIRRPGCVLGVKLEEDAG